MTLQHNPELKLWSRPGESVDDFAKRCDASAEDQADEAAAKIRTKLEKKKDTLDAALAKLEDRVEELETQKEGKRSQQLVDIGSSILGGLLGGRKRSSSMATAARRMNSGRSQAANIESRLETAENRVGDKIEDIEQLEYDLREALIEIDDEWTEKAGQIEQVEIPLEKTDIKIEDFDLVWLPLGR
jgi:predicted  nucleic acid-binding Zn-ribbon protein